MPTTSAEASRIVEISSEYLPPQQLHALLVKLDEEVGKTSENDSVKQSFAMFRALIEYEVSRRFALVHAGNGTCEAPQPMVSLVQMCHEMEEIFDAARESSDRPSIGWLYLFVLLWTIHAGLFAANVTAFFVLMFLTPWYIAVPLCSSIVWGSLTRFHCPLTRLENRVRLKLGWRPIRGFVGHYFFKPVRSFWRERVPVSSKL